MKAMNEFLESITKTVLIIEDFKPDIRLVKEVLRDRPYIEIKSVYNGVEALKYLRKEPPYKDVSTPDLILLDLNMPMMDGHEVLKIIKNDEQLKHIPVIILTISADDEDILESYNEHVNAYVIKPLRMDKFRDAIASIERFWFEIAALPNNST